MLLKICIKGRMLFVYRAGPIHGRVGLRPRATYKEGHKFSPLSNMYIMLAQKFSPRARSSVDRLGARQERMRVGERQIIESP